MSPRSLIFSSDQEMARLLGQALLELEFEVEFCLEIFAAVERITTQSFDLIVADWDDGLEALFLLKTSRELKMNAAAITVALSSDPQSAAAATQAGVAIILAKPVVVEQAKFKLLSSDDFLRGMRSWVPMQATSAETQVESPNSRSKAASQPAVASTPSAIDSQAGSSPAFPTLHLIHRRNSAMTRGKKHWTRLLSGACALGIALSSVGYVFSAPMHSREIATSVQQIYQQAVAKTHTWLEKSSDDSDEQNIILAQNGTRPATRAARIQVTPIHEYVEPSPLAPESSKPQSPPPTISKPDYGPVAVARIPDSLRSPALAARTVAERVTPTLLGGLEPVKLSEELAAQLLLQKVLPNYPQRALQAGLQGPVVFQAWIARDGSIRDLKLIQGSLLLGQAGYSAVKQWKYKPYLLNGQAVETQTYVTVNFATP
jgi:TonB family protein